MNNKSLRQTASGRRPTSLRRRLLPMLVAACFGTGGALANPVGPHIINGQVSISNQGNVLSITNSPGAIINWQGFSINAGEITRFIQQNADSAVLNRITGQDPSQILGTLQSNGRVFLVNPNGILFGQGAQIDVNGLVASTLNISNEDFLSGKMNFAAGATAGGIKNQGAITTPEGGQVYLIAPNIENSGIIASPKGDVMLAAGHTVNLVDSANPNLQVVLSAPEHEAVNLGQIVAQGGRTGIYGALIKQRGVVNANSAVVGENGKIVFKASKETLLESGSTTTATGAGQGGEIQVLGERVALRGNASIDASGQTGGGTVLIGGDYRGENPDVQNARRSFVSKDAQIKADAVVSGNGGKVIVWGDEAARVHGKISARGGAASGNGGLVETSGKYLDVNGISVDASAPNGATGKWLLDPIDIEIVTGGTTGLGNVDEFADTPATSQIDPSVINNAAATVELQATNNITFSSPVNMTTSGVGITAWAGNNIAVNADIVTNGGDVWLNANTAPHASGTGTVSINSVINSNGADVDMTGASIMFGSAGVVDVGAGDLYMSATDSITMASTSRINGSGSGSIDFYADNIDLNGLIQVGGPGGGKSVLLTPHTSSRSIVLGGKVAGALGLTATELANISALDLYIYSTGSGANLHVTAPFNFSGTTVKNVSLSSQGGIIIDAPVVLSSAFGTLDVGNWGTGAVTINAGGGLSTTGTGSILDIYNSGGILHNAGTLHSSGDLSIYVGGKLTNAGIISAGTEVSLHATKMALAGNGISTTDSNGIISLMTSDAVELGSTDTGDSGSGLLQLDNAELNTLHTANLRVYGGAGLNIRTAIAPAHVSKALNLMSGENITQDAGATIAVPALALSGKNINLREANDTGVIAADVYGDFAYRTKNQLTLSEVDGTYGLWRYSMPASAGTILLQSDSAHGINQMEGAGIHTSGATLVLKTPGPVRLHDYNYIDKLAAMTGAGGLELSNHTDLEIASSSEGVTGIISNNGNVVLRTGMDTLLSVNQVIDAGTGEVDFMTDRLALNATVKGSEASIRPFTGGRSITVGQVNCHVADCLSVTNLHQLAVETIGIGREPSETGSDPDVGPIHVAGITANGSATDRNSATKRIGLLSSSAVTQSGWIDVNELGVIAGGDVMLTHAGNRVSGLVGSSLEGNFHFASSTPLTVTSIAGDGYAINGVNTNGGSIDISGKGYLRVASNVSVTSDSGAIKLTAFSPLTVDGNVTSNTGDIFLEASATGSSADVLTVNGKVSTGGSITLKAGAGIVRNGSITEGKVQEQTGQQAPQVAVVTETINTIVNASNAAATKLATVTNKEPVSSSSNTDEAEGRKEETKTAATKEDGAKKNDTGKKLYCN